MPLRARDRHGVGEAPLGVGAGLERPTDPTQRSGVGDVRRVGLVRLEACRELVGLLEDLGSGPL